MNLDIKKAYDSVIRADAREIMRKVGINDDLINLWLVIYLQMARWYCEIGRPNCLIKNG